MRVLIVYGSSPVGVRIMRSLAEIPGLVIAGHTDTEAHALRLIESERPDVVVTDVSLREGSGLAVVRYLRRYYRSTRAFVVCSESDPAYRDAALRAGPDGFFLAAGMTEGLKHVVEELVVHASPAATPDDRFHHHHQSGKGSYDEVVL